MKNRHTTRKQHRRQYKNRHITKRQRRNPSRKGGLNWNFKSMFSSSSKSNSQTPPATSSTIPTFDNLKNIVFPNNVVASIEDVKTQLKRDHPDLVVNVYKSTLIHSKNQEAIAMLLLLLPIYEHELFDTIANVMNPTQSVHLVLQLQNALQGENALIHGLIVNLQSVLSSKFYDHSVYGALCLGEIDTAYALVKGRKPLPVSGNIYDRTDEQSKTLMEYALEDENETIVQQLVDVHPPYSRNPKLRYLGLNSENVTIRSSF